MKLLDIALKDLLQSSRTLSIYIFMFVIPIGVTLLFFFMFGSVTGNGDSNFELPQTSIVIVNLDQGQLNDLPGFVPPSQDVLGLNPDSASNMGQWLITLLESEPFQDLMIVSEERSTAVAKSMVDQSEVDLAIIIPENFTDVLTQSGDQATVEIYQDPALTFGPAIVESILGQILDAFSAAKITSLVTLEQLATAGVPIDGAVVEAVINEATAMAANRTGAGSGAGFGLVEIESISDSDEPDNIITEIVGSILGGMMIFFAFFTGSAGMETILTEEERGTLPRLFTTPTTHREILSGKGVAVIVTVTVQVAVLMFFGRLVFNIDWGSTPTTLLAAAGIIIMSVSTGLFLVSWLTNTRQSGIVFGGVLTLTGMIGLIGVFTAGAPNQPEAIQTISLLVPQGWAIHGLVISMDGGNVIDLLPIFGGLMVWSFVFSFIGQRRMRSRFA
ncbi:MAG: hypothetical protein BMS9Abin02_1468 [Anaerolineae bacterium]|nr:MAG: hypothetical protein BMS9Abin02_1468 [Anaerolineae bacterium]